MYFFSKRIMKRSFLWMLDRVVIPIACGGIFVRVGNFFNSEIVGKATDSPLGVKFVRDEYTEREVINATGIADIDAAYKAISDNPQFNNLLEQVPAKHPAQLYEAAGYVIVFAILYFMYWKTNLREQRGFIF